MCLGSLRSAFVKLVTIIVNDWSEITSIILLAHKTDYLRSAPSCCELSRSPDADVHTFRGISDIGGITVRLHTCTFPGCASSGDSNVHTGESNFSSMATLCELIGFSLRALH